MKIYKPEGRLIATQENKRYLSAAFTLKEAFHSGALLEGRVVRCDAEHNLHVDLGCMEGVIPRSEGAIGIDDFKGKQTRCFCYNRLRLR